MFTSVSNKRFLRCEVAAVRVARAACELVASELIPVSCAPCAVWPCGVSFRYGRRTLVAARVCELSLQSVWLAL